jgi:anaerobic magnesium-protoporphyrin IX monomethyl ester cyclase
MARLLITHPYHLALDPHEFGLAKPYTPITTLVAAAQAESAGHDVVFHDVMFEADEAHFAQVLDQTRPDRVAILADDLSVSVKMCLSRTRQATQTMARMAQERGVPVLVGGPDVSDHPELFLKAGATAAAVGDPTDVLIEWLADEDDILGLVGPGGAGGRRPVITDLDRLPAPARKWLDLAAYARTWRDRHGYWELNMSTARGCPYRCNWCAKPTWGRTYHVRSAADVATELVQLAELTGSERPDRIWMTDDIFALKPSWLRELREALDARVGPDRIPYRCLCRADLLRDPAYVEDLWATGCRELWIGAESGSDDILRAMDKDSTVAEIERATELTRARGIRIGFFLQLGYPSETLDRVLETVDMVKRLQPDEIGVSVSYPMPGTKFFESVSGSMRETNWSASMDNRPLFEAPYGEAFYRAAKEVLRSTHSSSKGPELVRAFIQQPSRRAARRIAGAAFHWVRLPVAHRQMRDRATPNRKAVPLTW